MSGWKVGKNLRLKGVGYTNAVEVTEVTEVTVAPRHI